MENKQTPQDILDKAMELYPKQEVDAIFGIHNNEVMMQVRKAYENGRLSEREDMFGFIEWVEKHTIKMGNSWMLNYAGDGGKLYTLQQLHQIYKTK